MAGWPSTEMTEHHISLDKLARSKANGAHSIFGASGAHMFLACPGSLIPNILTPDDGNADSAFGTVAHGVAESWLRSGHRPTHLLGTKEFVPGGEFGFSIEIDDEMLHYAEQCVDRCEWEPGEHVVERRVDFSHLTPIPNQGGTLDFAAMRPGRVTTKDHKFGASPENIVYAEENPQLMLYSIGLWRDPEFQHYNFKDFIIGINQPRLNHFDEWHTTAKRLAEFEDYARERMALAWSLDAPRVPGAKQCRFCKVAGSCSANAKLQEELTAAVFTDTTVTTVEEMQDFVRRIDDDLDEFRMHFAKVGELTTAQMAKLLPFRSMAESWWKKLEEELLQRSLNGVKVPGMKLVEGRSRRVFPNQEKAQKALIGLGLKRDDLINEKMISPNQAEKLLRKKGFKAAQLPDLMSGLVHKPPGRATLVPVSDKRPEVEDLSAVAFAPDETTETEED